MTKLQMEKSILWLVSEWLNGKGGEIVISISNKYITYILYYNIIYK